MDQSKKKKRPPRTLKERMFAKEYARNGGNATQAALKSYDTSNYNSAHVIGVENLQKLTMVDILDKVGVTDEKIGKTILDGMEANKTVSSYNTSKESNAETNDFIDVPDWQARLKATELASKMKGHLIEKRDLTTKGEKIMQNNYVSFESDDKGQATS